VGVAACCAALAVTPSTAKTRACVNPHPTVRARRDVTLGGGHLEPAARAGHRKAAAWVDDGVETPPEIEAWIARGTRSSMADGAAQGSVGGKGRGERLRPPAEVFGCSEPFRTW
jgi:hypothetical protein